MCADMCADMYMDKCIGISIGMCVDMCIGICMEMYRHVHRRVHRLMYKHEHAHMRSGECILTMPWFDRDFAKVQNNKTSQKCKTNRANDCVDTRQPASHAYTASALYIWNRNRVCRSTNICIC